MGSVSQVAINQQPGQKQGVKTVDSSFPVSSFFLRVGPVIGSHVGPGHLV